MSADSGPHPARSAWVCRPGVSIWASLGAQALFGIGIWSSFYSTFLYCIGASRAPSLSLLDEADDRAEQLSRARTDSYGHKAASALAALTFLRYPIAVSSLLSLSVDPRARC